MHRVLTALLARRLHRGYGGQKGLVARKVFPDYAEPLAIKDHRGREVRREKTGNPVRPVPRVHMDRRVRRGNPGCTAVPDSKARAATKVHPVRGDRRVNRDLLVTRDREDYRGRRVPLAWRRIRMSPKTFAEGGFPIELHSITVQTLHG